MGKKKLDVKKISYVQKLMFENYPCPSLEQEQCWAKCVKAIDSANRTLCHGKKMNSSNKENENFPRVGLCIHVHTCGFTYNRVAVVSSVYIPLFKLGTIYVVLTCTT